jgi:hypothetical protein
MLLSNDANYQRLDSDGLVPSGDGGTRLWKIAFISSFTVMILELIALVYAVNTPTVPHTSSPVPQC